MALEPSAYLILTRSVAAQVTLAEALVPGDLPPAPPAVKRLNEMVWEVRGKLEKVPKAALKELIELNGVYVSEKATPAGMLHGIADGLICGKLPPCPWCAGYSLELEGTLLRCYGYQTGSTHCTFKATTGPDLFGGPCVPTQADPKVLERTAAWILTPPIQRALKGWVAPPDAPVHKLAGASGGGGGGGGAAVAGGAGAAAAPVAAGNGVGASAVDEAPSEDEEVPPEQVMAGMSFATIGTLSPSSAELQALIVEHGGTFIAGSIGDGSVVTHLIASEAEVRKPAGKKASKYAAALEAGVPIVSSKYVLALAGMCDTDEEEEEEEEAVEVVEVVAPPGKRPKVVSGGATADDAIELGDDDDDDDDEEVEVDFDRLTVPKLREMCAHGGLDTSGRKPVLVARLKEAGGSSGGRQQKRKSVDGVGGKPAKAAKGGAGSSSAGGEPVVGAKLRQRKHMTKYLLDGQAGPKLPSISSVLSLQEARAAQQKSKEPPPRKMLPEIEPKSALVTVSTGSGLGSGWAVYVDEFNLAYNCTLNQMDIRTGVNKCAGCPAAPTPPTPSSHPAVHAPLTRAATLPASPSRDGARVRTIVTDTTRCNSLSTARLPRPSTPSGRRGGASAARRAAAATTGRVGASTTT